MFEITAIMLSGFLCGVLNAIAGGGTFVTLPVLLWVGVPPVAANATASATAVPGYVTSAWAYRNNISAEGSLKLGTIILFAAAGGMFGALLLVVTSVEMFVIMVPWLLLTATILFALTPKLLVIFKSCKLGFRSPPASVALILVVTTYGGYFNGGVGILLLSALSLQGYRNLHGMNGIKNLLSSILSISSMITFIATDLIVWDLTVPMIIGNVGGAYVASSLIQQIRHTDWLRFGIIGIGFTMSVLFFTF